MPKFKVKRKYIRDYPDLTKFEPIGTIEWSEGAWLVLQIQEMESGDMDSWHWATATLTRAKQIIEEPEGIDVAYWMRTGVRAEGSEMWQAFVKREESLDDDDY